MISRTPSRRTSLRRPQPNPNPNLNFKQGDGVSLSTLGDFHFSTQALELREKGWQRRLLIFDGVRIVCRSRNEAKKPKWDILLAQVKDIRVMVPPKGPMLRGKQPPCFVIDYADQHHILRLSTVMEFESWMFTLGGSWSRPPTLPGSNSAYDACLDAWNRSLQVACSDSSSRSKLMSPIPQTRTLESKPFESPPKIKTTVLASPTRRQPIPKPLTQSQEPIQAHRRNKSNVPILNPKIQLAPPDSPIRARGIRSSTFLAQPPPPTSHLKIPTIDSAHHSRARSFDYHATNHTQFRGWPSNPTQTSLLRPKPTSLPQRPLHFSSPPQHPARYSHT